MALGSVEYQQLCALAERSVGAPVSLTELGGERDINLRVTAGDGSRYVLKVAAADEPRAFADYEIDMLDHVRLVAPQLPVPRVMRDRDTGCAVTAWQPARSAPRGVRIYSYLPGEPMCSPGPALLRALGSTLAGLDSALSTFPAYPPDRPLEWDLRLAPQLRCRLDVLDDPGPARRALDTYQRVVPPVLAGLPTQPIHNDANPFNVLSRSGESVSGIIDFGDMVAAPAVQDLATACAYYLDAGDALEALSALVASYHRQRPLSATELDVLPAMIRARQVASVVISTTNAKLRPGNSHYLTRNYTRSWAGLCNLDRIGEGRVRSALDSATHQ